MGRRIINKYIWAQCTMSLAGPSPAQFRACDSASHDDIREFTGEEADTYRVPQSAGSEWVEAPEIEACAPPLSGR